MTCEQRKDLLFLYAAGALEPAEVEELREHLATGCPQCAGALAEAQATLAGMSTALPPVEPRPELKKQLMSRIASNPAADTPHVPSGGTSTAVKTTSGWKIFFAGAMSAAAAVVITSAVIWNSIRDDMRLMHSPDLHMVSLASKTQPTAHGRVLWDKENNQWHVAVFDMKPPPPGRVYELWFIPPGGKPVASKTFQVDESGKASLMVEVPKDIGPIAVAAITDEPGWVPAPTGAVQLAGNVP